MVEQSSEQRGSATPALAGERREPGTTRYWHPFANMAMIRGNELVLAEANGCEVVDQDGRRYLDATAGLWYCNVGYGQEAIVEAVTEQLRVLPAYSTFGPYATGPTLEAAARIADVAPVPDAAVFLTSGGSDAVDTAAKLVRTYWIARDQPQRRVIIGRPRAYHGMHAYGTSLAGIAANREGFGDMVPDVAHVAEDSVAAVRREIERIGPERVGAFIGEPVIGAGGVYPPEEGYWLGVAEVCREYDILLISDEVICGFGRLGSWFGCQRYEVTPDLVIFAKGVTSGYMPLGGLIVAPRVQEPFWEGAGHWFRHGYTYSGHAAACAAAIANLDILEQEDLAGRVVQLEPVLARQAGHLLSHPLVGTVRAVGLLCAIEMSPEAVQSDPALIDKVVLSCREQGVLTRALGRNAIQISPALVIEEVQINELFRRIGSALDVVQRTD